LGPVWRMHIGCSLEGMMPFGKSIDLGHDEINSLVDHGVDGLTNVDG
jgi:hypothetical protein